MINYCQPQDIVEKLCYKNCRYIIEQEKPTVSLKGEEKTFGWLIFRFSRFDVSCKIWIKNKKEILDSANYAIDNFEEIYAQISTT